LSPLDWSQKKPMNAFLMKLKYLFPVLGFLLVLPLASAQQDVGYILGTVTDPTGAALAGANITITWQSTGITQRWLLARLGITHRSQRIT
jgi:hypothetical protein